MNYSLANRQALRWCMLLFFLPITIGCKKETEKVKVTITSLTESVYASVTIQPEDKYFAFSVVGGIVNKVMVEEGDDVIKGQAILQIENDNPQLNAENARLAYELAKENYNGTRAQLREIQSLINSARLKLSSDSLNYARQKNLWNNKIGSKHDLEQRKLSYEIARNELASLKSRYAQTELQLQTQQKQAANTYRSSLNTTRDFTVRSEINGKVYDVLKNPGEIVLQQEPLAILGKRDVFILEMLVDEVDIARIRLGQTALVRLDAYDKRIFEAKVSKIYPNMDVRSQTFKVEAIFKERPDVLYPGLTGEANIITAVKENVITIPYDYLIDGKRVKTKDGEVEVKTGLMNFERVEIISGLDTGQFIYKPTD